MGVYPRFRRRHYFIKKGLQGKFVFGFSALVIFGFAANLAVVYFLIDRELEAGLYKTHLRVLGTSEIIWPLLWKLGVVTVPVIVIAAAVIGYYLTRRIETPLYNFMDALKKTGEGDFTRRLHTDSANLQEVAREFNETAEFFEKSFSAVKKSALSLERTVEGLNFLLTEAEDSTEEEVLEMLGNFTNQRKKVLKDLSIFKV
ncbi:MAG: hypothetical protein BMS9Abin23_0105 [Thermodesulfobacteriota bacterium]|nr:MAG: hypothetical protein BMS9Abin23_0105 [Thermodesulfobacteriota bacterium]